jgi:hypothetical protein
MTPTCSIAANPWLCSPHTTLGSATRSIPTASISAVSPAGRGSPVYLTGQDDSVGIDQDVRSRESMQEWCAFDLQTQLILRAGHEAAGPAALDRALDALADHQRPDPQRLAACRARVASGLAASLERAKGMLERGKSAEAWSLLKKIDTRYGGLAAPDSLELARKINVDSP